MSSGLGAHRSVALVATALIVPLAVWIEPAPSVHALWLLLPMLAVGIPHGGLDHLVAERLVGRGRFRPGLFAGAYLLMAGAVFAISWLAPPFALATLGLLSILHFGQGDASGPERSWERRLEVLVRGGLPILLPVAFHPLSVAEIVGWIWPNERTALALTAAAPWVLGSWLTCLTAWWLLRARSGSSDPEPLTSIAVLAASAIALPPLLSFGVYFCLWHSIRHLLTVAHWTAIGRPRRSLHGFVRVLSRGVPTSLIALSALGIFVVFRPPDLVLAAGFWRAVFLLLFALTLPHMIVTTFAFERLGRPS